MQDLQLIIDNAFEQRTSLTPLTVSAHIKDAVTTTIDLLDAGKLRIAEHVAGKWQINQWLKKAVLLYFRIHDNELMSADFTQFYDKVPLKFGGKTLEEIVATGIRIVPPATARKGAYIAPNTILMPSYINIGAYIDSGTMIDTWATIGSCAQIGKNVHISGGVGIGGVLEPLQKLHPF